MSGHEEVGVQRSQIVGILKEAEAGVPIPDLRRPSREPEISARLRGRSRDYYSGRGSCAETARK